MSRLGTNKPLLHRNVEQGLLSRVRGCPLDHSRLGGARRVARLGLGRGLGLRRRLDLGFRLGLAALAVALGLILAGLGSLARRRQEAADALLAALAEPAPVSDHVLEERLDREEQVLQQGHALGRDEGQVAVGEHVLTMDHRDATTLVLHGLGRVRVASEDSPREHAPALVLVVTVLGLLDLAAHRLAEGRPVSLVDLARLAVLAAVQEVREVAHGERLGADELATVAIVGIEEVAGHAHARTVLVDQRQLLHRLAVFVDDVDAIDELADHRRQTLELGQELFELLALAQVAREDLDLELREELHLAAFLATLGLDDRGLESVGDVEAVAALEGLHVLVGRRHRKLVPDHGLVLGHGNL